MDLNVFYAGVLKDVMVEDTTGSGHLSSVFDPEKPAPMMIGGKRLTMPHSDVLRAGSKDDQIIFHPLSENITRAESDVIKSLRDLIQWRCHAIIVVLAQELGRVAATTSEHKRLGPQAGKYLKQVPDFDERTYDALVKKVLKRASVTDPERRLISITLRQGSKSKGDGVLRSATVHFPIFEDFARDDLDVLGTALPSKKAKAKIAKLFEIILGTDDERAAYSYGSSNMDAPYLHALLTVFHRIGVRLNAIVATHKKLLGDDLAGELTLGLDWIEGLDEFARLRAAVPPQKGNEGAIKVDTETGKIDKAPVTERAAPVREKILTAPPTERPAKEEIDVPWEDGKLDADRRRDLDRELAERREDNRRLSDRRDTRDSRDRDSRDRDSGGTSIGDFMNKLHGRRDDRRDRDDRDSAPRQRVFGGGYASDRGSRIGSGRRY